MAMTGEVDFTDSGQTEQAPYTASAIMTTACPPTFEMKLIGHRDCLLRFARLQLRNDAWAEDAVSETVLAALAKPQAFENRSQLKTWLVCILKHKVIDALRHHSREISGLGSTEDDTDPLEHMQFTADGHFSQTPADWGNPEQQFSSRQFFEVMDACITKLPASQGRLFLMREGLERHGPRHEAMAQLRRIQEVTLHALAGPLLSFS